MCVCRGVYCQINLIIFPLKDFTFIIQILFSICKAVLQRRSTSQREIVFMEIFILCEFINSLNKAQKLLLYHFKDLFIQINNSIISTSTTICIFCLHHEIEDFYLSRENNGLIKDLIVCHHLKINQCFYEHNIF